MVTTNIDRKIMLLLCAMMIFSSSAIAAPSLSGSTGLINTPSADCVSEGRISLGYYQLKNDTVNIFNIGISPNFEIGVAKFNYAHQSNDTLLNIKYNILSENEVMPGISVGIEDLTASSDRSSYIVMSKKLPFGFKLNAGVGNGRFDGAFAGIEATFNPLPLSDDFFPATTMIAERDGHTTNFGLRIAIAPGLKAEVGRKEHRCYIGATFTN